MEGISDNINKNSSISVSRNTPVALIVGAASFLGSHLTDKLLSLNIAVLGVDDFSSGKNINLEDASKDKNFHLINTNAENLHLEVERLDYIFILASSLSLERVLAVAKQYKSRLVLVSSIELYDRDILEKLHSLKKAESHLAKFASENNLNARVIRLSAVFGPRMNFSAKDPMIRLIQAALLDELQKEIVANEFSSRALYVSDAVDLIVKSMMSGATSQKIFDGVSSPVKVSEIKQILLDPIWHESRNFEPSELPPWPTPNLEKTMKFLSWKQKKPLVLALKETINYFKDKEVSIPKMEIGHLPVENARKEEIKKWLDSDEPKKISRVEEKKIEKASRSWKLPRINIFLLLAIVLFVYAIIYPVGRLAWGVFSFRSYLTEASESISKGDFDKSLKAVKKAEGSVRSASEFVSSIEVLRRTNFWNKEFEAADSLISVAGEINRSTEHAVLGTKYLYNGLKAVSGESTGDPGEYLNKAQAELSLSDQGFSKSKAVIDSIDLSKTSLFFLNNRLNLLSKRVSDYSNLVSKTHSISLLLPKIVALDSKKSYLILLQNNSELRPGGGFIGSIAKIDFEKGKLKKIDVQDVYNIDGQLSLHVEPPKEIKEDLGQKDWYLRDSNWEPDFPTSARQAEWFYTKETGSRVDGVIALDVSSMEDLISVVGELKLDDYNEVITSSNLFERTLAHSEQGFFPGSQAKKNFLTSLSLQMFNKVFFLPNINWPGVVGSLNRSLEGKHIMVYFADPKMFSFIVSQNYGGILPRPAETQAGITQDFLSVVEANLGANKANYYLDRSYNLETTIGKEGEINHKLRINYTNRSPSGVWPAGQYKNRLRVYLPFGTKLQKALWGEKDITQEASTFVDYGRTGYSFLLTLDPKQQKVLVLEYQLSGRLSFKEANAKYVLDIVKQPGTLKDPLRWNLTYPINFEVSSIQNAKSTPQELDISTDLSRDRRFEATFTK